MATRGIRKIKHKARGQDANKAWDKAECFIGIKAVHQVLYFMYIQQELGHALTVLKNLQMNA